MIKKKQRENLAQALEESHRAEKAIIKADAREGDELRDNVRDLRSVLESWVADGRAGD